MRDESVEMICSIGELASIFERSHSLEELLQAAVEIVANHMKAAVCSIYLYDEERHELVLKATQGLKQESVGHVRLQLGEGITGLALKELRPIREGRGSQNPNFKYIPETEEDRFEAFLAVPILHGLTRIGVLVAQDTQPDYFTETDTKALRAITVQLATVIESTRLFMALNRPHEAPPEEDIKGPIDLSFLRGKSVSRGVAKGKAMVVGSAQAATHDPGTDEVTRTPADFEAALAETEKQLASLQTEMDAKLMDVASFIFSAQLLMLKDKQFSGTMRQAIESGRSPQEAIREVVATYVQIFSNSPNARLKEKVQDVQDLGHRLLANLAGTAADEQGYAGHLLIAEDLLPSDMLKFVAQGTEGLVLIGSGLTAHISILARSLEIPMVLTDERALLNYPPHTLMLVDANQGSIFVNPDDDVLERYDALLKAAETAELSTVGKASEAKTRDGVRVRLMANINLLSDIKIAKDLCAEGVGLYRTEFPFIIRSTFPSEEEQYRVYSQVVNEMSGREVIFRTLDIGGDKVLSYYPHGEEANPFLGLRALRFSFKNREIFSQQLRALLRAGADTTITIMFPMVSSVDDFLEAKRIVHECSVSLKEDGLPRCEHVELGVMIELPAAVEIADDLAKEADFFCIGTNDLVQYMLAVDRTNDEISNLYISHHPAVLRALNRVTSAALRHGIPVSVCGEMATEQAMLPFLLGIGIRTLSADPHVLPQLRQTIAGITLTEAEQQAKELLAISKVSDVVAALGL